MDHSWRPPRQPRIPGTICPICSISHMPFCPPPPPPFMENPRFHYSQPQIDYHLPFTHHNHPFPNHQTYYCNPSDGNPTLNMNPYGKRMKFDNSNSNRGFPSESERILKLIHDHGTAPANNISGVLHYPHTKYETSTTLPHLPTQSPNSVSGTNLDPQPPSLFPVAVTCSSLASAVVENQPSSPVYYTHHHASPLSSAQEFHIPQSLSDKHARDIQPFPSRHVSSQKIDASRIFKQPHRASRPDHFVLILRGLPGSGKSYLAKLLRDIEVENGGEAPRIHSMDDYFMIEVEKAEDSELSNSSGSFRGKRQVMKTVMEYCYEAEMEEAYRASMLKAFKKTLDEGVYSFIIVDDRNLRVADFAQFWATAKRSGYEVYLVEASYKDPVGCAARNVHNFTLSDVQKMARQWEEAPSLYLRMDIKSLLHGEGFVESGIQEVDMDMEDEDAQTRDQVDDDFRPHGIDEANAKLEEAKDLRRSKWSNDLDEEEGGGGGGKKTNIDGALSGLIQAYSSKATKSVCWGDQGGNVGFSISAAKKTNTRSLVIGPGPGYNLRSNPLSEKEHLKAARNANNQNVFQQRIRAERESFKAVFDKRRQRIGGFNVHDDDE